MTTFVVLRLKELLAERKMAQAELARRTAINPSRINCLCRNQWEQVTRKEMALLLDVLETTLGELFSVHQASVFFGARWAGPLTIHVSARPQGNGADPADAGAFNHRDMQAYQLLLDHGRGLGIDVAFEPHGPDSMTHEEYRAVTGSGSHFLIGSNRNGQLCEYAVAQMYRAPAFDSDMLDRFPFNFSWGPNYAVGSSFGFKGSESGHDQGIYSTAEQRLVARRRHRESGVGEDCGMIAVMRIEDGRGDRESGLRRERCVIVVAGHGRYGTLGCARVLVDPQYRAQLYPEKSGRPRMFAVQAEYFRPAGPVGGGPQSGSLTSASIVAEG